MDWHFRQGDKVCTFRAAAVLIDDGRVLVQRSGREYALPAVRVSVGATAEETLVREFRRETGVHITVTRLIWVDESLWSSRGTDRHTITFYFLAECADGFPYEKFGSQKKEASVLFEWAELERVKSMNIYPEFIKEKITDISDGTEHFISRE